VYLADTAAVFGQVSLGADVSVWYGASIRGDVAPVVIGPGSNVQDNAVVHCDSGVPNVIGRDVVIGHGAVVHGKAVGDGSLIGINATVLGGSVIGQGCLVAAGALVPPGLVVPDGHAVMGVPGKVVRPVNDKERGYLAWLAPHYVALARRYVERPNDPTVRRWGAAKAEQQERSTAEHQDMEGRAM